MVHILKHHSKILILISIDKAVVQYFLNMLPFLTGHIFDKQTYTTVVGYYFSGGPSPYLLLSKKDCQQVPLDRIISSSGAVN